MASRPSVMLAIGRKGAGTSAIRHNPHEVNHTMVKAASSDIVAAPREVVSAWVTSLRLQADSVEQDFDPSAILAAILNAESFDAAVEAQQSGILSGKNLVGVPH